MSEWWKDLFTVMKEADVRQVGYVPDAGHSKLINACIADPEIDATVLTTEEEGVALAAGAWLGGDRAALLAAARLYVGGDTGPMHVASLVGTPVVQLLGPTDAIENAPWSETPSRSVRAPAGARDPMDIEPVAVLEAARDLLAQTRAPARAGAGRH